MTRTFQPLDLVIAERHRAEALLEDLRILSIIDAKTVAQADAHFRVADQAQTAAENFRHWLEGECARIGRELASAVGVDLAAIRAEVAKLPAQEDIVRVCEAMFTESVSRGVALAVPSADYVGVLNAEFDGLAERAGELAVKLSGIAATAEEALQAGKGDEWLEAGALQGTFQWLSGVVERLQAAGKLAAPHAGESGPWWRFRKPVARDSRYRVPFDQLPDGGRERFFNEMSAAPYVAASRDEALAVRRKHDAVPA